MPIGTPHEVKNNVEIWTMAKVDSVVLRREVKCMHVQMCGMIHKSQYGLSLEKLDSLNTAVFLCVTKLSKMVFHLEMTWDELELVTFIKERAVAVETGFD